MTADSKYTLVSRDNLMEPIQIHFSQKQKTFSRFFCAFFKSTSNFEHFQTKMTLIAYVFPWEDPFTSNVVNRSKHWFNLNGSSFTIFVDHCEANWVGKSRSYRKSKSQNFFLTHRLPMTSILFLVETIQYKQVRCIYRKNKKLFLNLFVYFSNLHQILNIFKNTWPA